MGINEATLSIPRKCHLEASCNGGVRKLFGKTLDKTKELPMIPYYRKLTFVLINVFEIKAT